MNIIVSAAALRTSGGNTIYLQFLKHLSNYVGNNFYYIFVDSDMQQPYIKGVEYICVNLRTHIKRCLFDYFSCKKMIRKKGIEPDIIISLQNVGIYCLRKKPHLIYFHQSIPLYPHQWNPFKAKERTLFFYKHIYPLFIKATITSNTHIVVQTHFIKKRFVEHFGCKESNVHINFPDIERVNSKDIANFEYDFNYSNFIYPATGLCYKNHFTLFRALYILKKQHPEISDRVRIYITISQEKYPEYIKYISRYGLINNIFFIGQISRLKLFSMYKTSNGLLFPSTLETIGLPLLEAASMGIPILVSELEYAIEILKDYEGAIFIPPYNYQYWADEIRKLVLSQKKYSEFETNKESSWKIFFSLVESLSKK